MDQPQSLAGELVLDRYRPLSPLGSGGSGSVWLARDEREGGQVALKIVPREGKAGSRAEREVAAAARLRHPRCLKALDFASDDGHVYIAYEYVRGQTFRHALRDGRIDDKSAVEACAQILDALAHAHSQGIVHRDVKPANVLLAESETMDVRLLDFGLAQLSEAETLTALGDVPGTLAYIAPERLAGEPAGPAADVWAVGVVLWESLVGWHPFWNGSLLETARNIEEGAAPLRTVRPDLPRPLLAAVERALSLDPSLRPSAAQLADALHRAFRPRAEKPARRPLARRQLKRVGLLPALLATVAVGWGVSWFPFYPEGAVVPLALLAGVATLLSARVGLVTTLALMVLPLGNISLGLALLYVLAAAGWLRLFWKEPERGFAPAIGPMLGPVGLVAVLPLALQPIQSSARRASAVAAGLLLAALAAGVRGGSLPLSSVGAPRSLGITAESDLLSAAAAIVGGILSQPLLLLHGALLVGVALALPHARAYGRWGPVWLAAGMLAVGLAFAGSASAVPLVLGAWIIAFAVPAREQIVARVEQAAADSRRTPRRHAAAA